MNDVYRPLAETRRGRDACFPFQETLHHGAIAVVAGDGRAVTSVGDPHTALPLRSTAKPFQLLPLLLDGVASRGSDVKRPLDARDIALMMSSHNGEPMHVERVESILDGAGLTADHLRCGVQAPMHEPSRLNLQRLGQTPSALHCNCSGKHANMLLVCQQNGWPLESYLEPTHPLQQRIKRIIATLSDTPEDTIPEVMDGCSLPSLVLPLAALARLFARLAAPRFAPDLEGRNIRTLLEQIYVTGTRYPAYTAGSGRFETELMDALGARVFAKTGAAGLFAMAVAPSGRHRDGLGIAIKVADGDVGGQVRSVVATETLRQLGIIDDSGAVSTAIDTSGRIQIRNFRNRVVGELGALFSLA